MACRIDEFDLSVVHTRTALTIHREVQHQCPVPMSTWSLSQNESLLDAVATVNIPLGKNATPVFDAILAPYGLSSLRLLQVTRIAVTSQTYQKPPSVSPDFRHFERAALRVQRHGETHGTHIRTELSPLCRQKSQASFSLNVA